MPEEKGLGSKLLGLFVERQTDDETPAEGSPAVESGEKSAAELVAELAGQSAPKKGHPAGPQGQVGAPPAPLRSSFVPPPPSGPVTPATVDFDAVFKGAGLDAGELDRVRKAEELLRSLPEATPQDVKRQIVEASLKAFGFDVQKIAGAAQSQLKALDTWVRINETQTAKGITDAQAQIAQYEDKIVSLRADITRRTEQLGAMGAAADQRKAQVNKVLEFFHAAPPAPPAPKP